MAGIKPKEKVNKRWSSDLAYAVGLIVTDGNLSPDGRHMDFTSKDLELVRTFKRCLGLTNKIGTKSGSYKKGAKYFHVQFGDVIFYKWLVGLGLMPNKSKKIGELAIPDRYFFDFLRGHFDGDGCIHSYWDPRWDSSHMFYTKFTSASRQHLFWLQSTIGRLVDVSGRIGPACRSYQLVFAKKDSLVLFKKMFHSDSISFLKRKFIKARRIFENENRHNKAAVAKLVHAYV